MKKLCTIMSVIMLLTSMNIGMIDVCAADISTGEVTISAAEMTASSEEGVNPRRGMPFLAGDWYEYEVTSPKEMECTFTLSFSYARKIYTFRIEVNGEQQWIGDFKNPGNGKVTLGNITLAQGLNKIRLSVVTEAYHINEFTLKAVDMFGEAKYRPTEGVFRSYYLPAKMQAEDFDYARAYSADGTSFSGNYREEAPINILQQTGRSTAEFATGSGAEYSFYCEYDAVYMLSLAANGYGKINISVDGSSVYEKTTEVKEYNEEQLFPIYMKKGFHTVSLKNMGETLSVDYLRFKYTESEDFIISGRDVLTDEVKEETEDASEQSREIYKEIFVSPSGDDKNSGTNEEPVQTLQRASEIVKEIAPDMTGDIIVNILGGEHSVKNTLILNEEHSGRNGFYVIYRGAAEGDRTVLNGGIKLEGWEKENEYVYKKHLPEVEDMRTLFVNERIAVRAESRYGYGMTEHYDLPGNEYITDGFTVSKQNFPQNLTNPSSMELSWIDEWSNQRIPVDDIIDNGDSYIILCRQPMWSDAQGYGNVKSPGNTQFKLENAYELLDCQGEWYFNKQTKYLYYYPLDSEPIEESDIYVGAIEGFVNAAGSNAENRIQNIIFENIDFCYADWLSPNTYGSTSGSQSDIIQKYDGKNGLVFRQFQVDYADSFIIKRCNFHSMGSSAVGMQYSVSNSVIKECTFAELGGAGISISTSGEQIDYCRNITVKNNVVRRIGQQYFHCVGIGAYYLDSIKILHNDISNTPYSGISLGYGFGRQDYDYMRNHEVAYNKISDTMQLLRDGAGYYSLGMMKGTTVHDNYITSSGTSVCGMYFDNGTRYVETFNNVIDPGKDKSYVYINSEGGNINMHDDYTTCTNLISDSATFPYTMENITQYTADTVPAAAQQIIANSGLEKSEVDLLEADRIKNGAKQRTRAEYNNYVFKSNASAHNFYIAMRDYMGGGEGVGYHAKDTKNSGGQYRSDGIDIHPSRHNPDLNDVGVNVGEWLKYKINVKQEGEYRIRLWGAASSDSPQGSFNLYLDDALAAENVQVTYKGQINNYSYTYVEKPIYLTKGEHIIKFEGCDSFFGATFLEFFTGDFSQYSSDYYEGQFVTIEEEKGFSDIENHWAKEYIEAACKKGYVKGMTETIFAPDSKLTHLQAMIMLLRVLGVDSDIDSVETKAKEYGIIVTEQLPNGEISREQYIAAVMNAYVSLYGKYQLTYDMKAFSDIVDANKENINAILGAKALNLITGDENGRLNPRASLTRAEATKILMQLSKKL